MERSLRKLRIKIDLYDKYFQYCESTAISTIFSLINTFLQRVLYQKDIIKPIKPKSS